MATKNIFKNLSSIDTGYLLDPSVIDEKETVNPQKDIQIQINKLQPFRNHPFHVDVEEESFKQLVESIADNGVIYPIIVRNVPGKADYYEIVSGHCRVEACRQLGIDAVPAQIRDMDDFLATVVMTHSNISGRERISVSEKAKAYRMCMDLEKHRGKKGDETASVIGAGKDSTRQVYRFVHLSYLIPEFLELIDNGRLPLQIGNELAYIQEAGQKELLRFCIDFKQFPNLEQAKILREMDTEESPLTYERVIGVLVMPKKEKTNTKVTFKTKDISSYFEDDTDPDRMSEIIIRLLEKYSAGEIAL